MTDKDNQPAEPRSVEIFGMSLHAPRTSDLAFTALFAVVFGIVFVAMELPPPILAALILGWVISDCGVSILKHGARAILVYLVVGALFGMLL